jgi:hypothetical protein
MQGRWVDVLLAQHTPHTEAGIFTVPAFRVESKKTKKVKVKTYNIRDSLVVTDPTTSLTLTSLSRGERTGSRIFWWVWSYVTVRLVRAVYELSDGHS